MQQLHLAPGGVGRQRKVHRRAAEVTVPLRDLVGEVELVAEDRGHDLADRPVILMRVVARRREDEVRRAGSRHLLQDLLHLAPDGGQPALGQIVQVDARGPRPAGRRAPRGAPRPGDPPCRSAPRSGPAARLALGQAEQRPAGADLDVVGMRADREHGQRPARRRVQVQRQHARITVTRRRCGTCIASAEVEQDGAACAAVPERSGSQIIQGQFPRSYISSSWARSFTVSAGDQYPLYG